VKLSNIARALNENIPLIKTENRLSRQITKEDFSKEIKGEKEALKAYKGSRNMVALVHAVFYFLSIELGGNLKLTIGKKN